MQRPDHVTLWRFYKQYRKSMKKFLKGSVRKAIEANLVDFELQALDGCRVAVGSAEKMLGRAALEKALAKVEAEIAAMVAANAREAGEDEESRRPTRAAELKLARLARLKAALEVLSGQEARQARAGKQPYKRVRKTGASGPTPAGGGRR